MKTFKQFNEGLGRAGLGALKAIGRFGAKNPKNLAITLGTTALVAPKVGELAYKTKETVGNVVNNVTNFDPLGNAREKNIKKKQKEYREKTRTTEQDGYFYDPTIDKNRKR